MKWDTDFMVGERSKKVRSSRAHTDPEIKNIYIYGGQGRPLQTAKSPGWSLCLRHSPFLTYAVKSVGRGG